jgi:hypothetical protein
METPKRRAGRPKSTPQSGPLVLAEDLGRERIDVEINAAVAGELRAYTRWVELSGGISTTDAMAKIVEYAIRAVFQRDRLWKERRRNQEGTDSPPPDAMQPKPVGPPSSSLPPSVPRPLPPPSARAFADRAVTQSPEKSP